MMDTNEVIKDLISRIDRLEIEVSENEQRINNIIDPDPNEISITFTKEEAIFIKAVFQNPLGHDNPCDEDEDIRELRYSIFHKINVD